MEPEGSLPSSQELSTCTYPEPDQSSPQPVSTTGREIVDWSSLSQDKQVMNIVPSEECGNLNGSELLIISHDTFIFMKLDNSADMD
jgi:hypothetical protein